MAKQFTFKRIIDSRGQARYYRNGKRISDKKGRAKYIRENFSQITLQSLTQKETRSYTQAKAQRSLDRFRGRPVPKLISFVFRNVLEVIGPDPVDFGKMIKDGKKVWPRYSDLLRQVDFAAQNFPLRFQISSGQGLPGFRGRTKLESVADIVENFTRPEFSSVNFHAKLPEFLTPPEVTGRIKTFEAIAFFETAVTESVMNSPDRDNVAFVRFEYQPDYDFIGKMVTFDLRVKSMSENARDFADLKYYGVIVTVMTSDPKKRSA